MIIALKERIVELERENSQLKLQVMTDPMTGIGNRRAFDHALNKYAELARRNDLNLFLIIIDIDNFKSINDTLGHAEGDKVLKEVAKNIKKSIRFEDEPYRIGGDEFAVLAFDGTCEDIARTVCKRIQGTSSVSLSIGIGKHEFGSPLSLFEQVDTLMYESKQNGKGKIVF